MSGWTGAGDPPASWRDLFERYYRLIYSVPLRYGLPRHDAEDVFQETWLLAIQKGPPPTPERVVPYLASIAHWKTRESLRKRRPQSVPPAELAAIRAPDDPVPQEILERMEAMQAVIEALDSLSARERELIEMLFLSSKPLSYNEVAAIIGKSVGTLGSKRRRILEKLKRILRSHGF